MKIVRYSHITPLSAVTDRQEIKVPASGNFLTSLYRTLAIDYPKFFKMDNLSKLGFLASELLFMRDENRFVPREDMAVICFNRSASLETDTNFQASIQDADAYFPSPSIFVYTLPNIVTGEIAIRNKLYGETSFYVCQTFDAAQLFHLATDALQDRGTRALLVAWIESYQDNGEAFMMQVEVDGNTGSPFTISEIERLYNKQHKQQSDERVN